jgi:hypothetical protein
MGLKEDIAWNQVKTELIVEDFFFEDLGIL